MDITPPPGVSTFGHGPDALVTDGYWTRLYCRVFVVTAAEGPMAIVPCDLPATSMVLQRSIAQRIADLVPTARLFVGATHTHAGPAHYFETGAFSGPLSTHMPGFDPRMVAFLADRIANGVREAYARIQPAAVRSWHYEWGDPCAGASCGMWGITWNRSLGAHRLDGDDDVNVPAGLCAEQRAIDPSMHVIRFDALDRQGHAGEPLGMLVFFAMHPTVLPNTNRLLGADVDGALSRLLERDMRIELAAPARGADGAADPLAGIVNTNEGDMSPRWLHGTKEEALDVAGTLADRVRALVSTPAARKADAAIGARYLEVRLPDASDGRTGTGRVCASAQVGQSVAYGACDHPTTSTSGLPPSFGSADENCQFPKETPGGPLENLLAGGKYSFQQYVALGLVELDDSFVAFVPAELTIDAGRAIRREILKRRRPQAHAIVAGLSNGYILYVTTPEEYAYRAPGAGCALATDSIWRQSYEAASTVYGPATLALLVDRFGALADSLTTGGVLPGLNDALASPYRPLATVHRLPIPTGGQALRRADFLCELDPRTVCFSWMDDGPGDSAVTSAPWIYLSQSSDGQADREVPTCRAGTSRCDPLEGIDDRGTDFVTRARTMASSGTRWITLWRGTDSERQEVKSLTTVRIRVRGHAGKPPVDSPPLGTNRLAPCAADQRALCGDYEETVNQTPFPCKAAP